MMNVFSSQKGESPWMNTGETSHGGAGLLDNLFNQGVQRKQKKAIPSIAHSRFKKGVQKVNG